MIKAIFMEILDIKKSIVINFICEIAMLELPYLISKNTKI